MVNTARQVFKFMIYEAVPRFPPRLRSGP